MGWDMGEKLRKGVLGRKKMVMEIRNHVFFFIDVGHQYVHHSQQGIHGAKIKGNYIILWEYIKCVLPLLTEVIGPAN